MIHSANANYDLKKKRIVKKADFLVSVFNWIIIKIIKMIMMMMMMMMMMINQYMVKTLNCRRMRYFNCPLYDLFTTNNPRSNINGSY